MQKMKLARLKVPIIGTIIFGIGIAGFVLLVALRPAPPKEEKPKQSPLVSTIEPEIRQGHLTVRGHGTVRPVLEVNLAAEVAGKVVETAPMLVSGGHFAAGDVLLRIDPVDYEYAATAAEADVTQRQYDLLLAQEEQRIARDEWERLQRRTEEPVSAEGGALGRLVLKEPQLRLAQARLKSAEARLAEAQTRLARTRIAAPFNGRVRAKMVDRGQYVTPGQTVATIYGTDDVEIVVPLPSHEASLIPGLWKPIGRRARIPATVHAEFGGRSYQWQGYVDRTEGALDANTLEVKVVVRVSHPYHVDASGRPPLLVDMFTTVEIQGVALDQYAVLPREAVREGDTVWVVEDDALRVRAVEVVQEFNEHVYLTGGVTASDRVVTSDLAVMAEGMTVRVAEE